MSLNITPLNPALGAVVEGIDLRALGYECVRSAASEKATHVVLRRRTHDPA